MDGNRHHAALNHRRGNRNTGTRRRVPRRHFDYAQNYQRRRANSILNGNSRYETGSRADHADRSRYWRRRSPRRNSCFDRDGNDRHHRRESRGVGHILSENSRHEARNGNYRDYGHGSRYQRRDLSRNSQDASNRSNRNTSRPRRCSPNEGRKSLAVEREIRNSSQRGSTSSMNLDQKQTFNSSNYNNGDGLFVNNREAQVENEAQRAVNRDGKPQENNSAVGGRALILNSPIAPRDAHNRGPMRGYWTWPRPRPPFVRIGHLRIFPWPPIHFFFPYGYRPFFGPRLLPIRGPRPGGVRRQNYKNH